MCIRDSPFISNGPDKGKYVRDFSFMNEFGEAIKEINSLEELQKFGDEV